VYKKVGGLNSFERGGGPGSERVSPKSVDTSAINLMKDWCELLSVPSVLKLKRLGVVVMKQKITHHHNCNKQ